MAENQKPSNEDKATEQPANNEQDQELDEQTLDEVAGGTMQAFYQMMSNILKGQNDTVKKISDNLR